MNLFKRRPTENPIVDNLLALAMAKGSDRQFLDWVSFQPSIIDGNFTQWQGDIGRNIPCHVRRLSNGSGMGYKPKYSAVPMTDRQHRIQTEFGEAALLLEYKGWKMTNEQAAEWFDMKRIETLEEWIRS